MCSGSSFHRDEEGEPAPFVSFLFMSLSVVLCGTLIVGLAYLFSYIWHC
jgi:hypothetical protein